MTDAEKVANHELAARVLRVFEPDRGADYAGLIARVDDDNRMHFMAMCSDFFYWGTADAEHITLDNVAVLEAALEECKAAHPNPKLGILWADHAPTLFCARVRNLRPQGAAYKTIPGELWSLFNAAGPERAVDLCNPRPIPEQPCPTSPRLDFPPTSSGG